MWPEIEALARWGDEVNRVVILPVDGHQEDGGAADRLMQFGSKNFPDVVFSRTAPIDAHVPTQVVTAIREQIGDDERWLICGSGGTRLMFLGGLLAAQQMPQVELVCRDSEGPWFQVQPTGETRPLEGFDPQLTERFTVGDLLRVTWSDEERDATILDHEIDESIQRAATATIAGAPWDVEFGKAHQTLEATTGSKVSQGPIFEQFVLSLVRGMGVQADDVGINAVLFDAAKPVQEVDVVVNTGGRLHVIDCKLSAETAQVPIGTQIRDAFATRRHIGDGADQYIMLRPSVIVGEEFRSLCAAYNIQVIDQHTLNYEPLPIALAKLLDPPLTFDRSVQAPPVPPERSVPEGVLDMVPEIARSGSKAQVFNFGSIVVVKINSSLRHEDVRRRVLQIVNGEAEVISLRRHGANTAFIVLIGVSSKSRHAVLERFVGLDRSRFE